MAETSWSAESVESKLGSGTQRFERSPGSPVQAQSVSVQSDQDGVERGRPGLQRLNMH